MTIKVKATQRGFYRRLREPGDEFVIDEQKDFSKEWMEKLGRKKLDQGQDDEPITAPTLRETIDEMAKATGIVDEDGHKNPVDAKGKPKK